MEINRQVSQLHAQDEWAISYGSKEIDANVMSISIWVHCTDENLLGISRLVPGASFQMGLWGWEYLKE